MDQEKKDRRVRRTRQLLQDALLSLLKEKRYEDISVQDIIQRADVARSTFYVHYVDKDDLLMGGQGIFAGGFDQHSGERHFVETKNISVFSVQLWFQHIKMQSPILKIMEKDSAMELAMKTLHGIIKHDVEDKVQRHLKIENGAVPSSLIVDYLAGSLMILLTWWLKQGMPHPPERMDEIFQQLVMPGVSSFLEDRII